MPHQVPVLRERAEAKQLICDVATATTVATAADATVVAAADATVVAVTAVTAAATSAALSKSGRSSCN